MEISDIYLKQYVVRILSLIKSLWQEAQLVRLYPWTLQSTTSILLKSGKKHRQAGRKEEGRQAHLFSVHNLAAANSECPPPLVQGKHSGMIIAGGIHLGHHTIIRRDYPA